MSKIIKIVMFVLLALSFLFSLLILNKNELPLLNMDEIESSDSAFLVENKNNQHQSIYALEAHFPDKVTQVIRNNEPVFVEEVIDNSPKLTNEIKYISTITKSNRVNYYFKNTRTGRLITLSENNEDDIYSIISIEKDFFILQAGEKKYKVIKK